MDFLISPLPQGLSTECLRNLVLEMSLASRVYGETNAATAAAMKEIECETHYFLDIRLRRMDSLARWNAGLRANRWGRAVALGDADKDNTERDLRDLDDELDDINNLHRIEMDYLDNDARFQTETPTEEEAFDHYELWTKIEDERKSREE